MAGEPFMRANTAPDITDVEHYDCVQTTDPEIGVRHLKNGLAYVSLSRGTFYLAAYTQDTQGTINLTISTFINEYVADRRRRYGTSH